MEEVISTCKMVVPVFHSITEVEPTDNSGFGSSLSPLHEVVARINTVRITLIRFLPVVLSISHSVTCQKLNYYLKKFQVVSGLLQS